MTIKKGALVYIENMEGKVLVVSNEKNIEVLGLPGGKVEAGETFLDAVCRELKEETGFYADKKDFIYLGNIKEHSHHDGIVYDVGIFKLSLDKIIEIGMPLETFTHPQFVTREKLLSNMHFKSFFETFFIEGGLNTAMLHQKENDE